MSESKGDPTKDPRRIMRGLRIHRDVAWDYSFWRPLHWTRFDMQEQYGFIYSPEDDSRTGFYVAVKDLSDVLTEPVSEEDLPVLRDGVVEGMQSLPDCEILEEKEIAKGFAIGLEFLLTFSLDGETCMRRMRLLYNDRQQFTLYGQGAPVYEYQVFHDTYEFIYSTFAFADQLAASGVPPSPESVTTWEGDTDKVRTAPLARRDHSDWVKQKMSQLDAAQEQSSSES